MQDPAEVARGLEEIAALLSFEQGPKLKIRARIRAYEQGAAIVDTLGPDLAPLIEQDRLRTVQGIGAVLSGQIRELWNTGTSELLAGLRRELPEGAAELIRVQGMTPRRIRALNAALGIRSTSELLAACVDGRVRRVPGFGEKTEQLLRAACERWMSRSKPPPPHLLMTTAQDLAELLREELAKVPAGALVAGALRRCEETVGELDLVVVGDVLASLEQLMKLRQVVRIDRARSTALLGSGIPVQLHAGLPDLGNALFLATGNAAHVAAVCDRAHQRGFELDARAGSGARSHALPPRTFESEEALYAALDLAYVPPELRQGTDELERATRADFADLVQLEDIQGMVHCHTTYSDGKDSIVDMAMAAHHLGMRYITITDHSPSAHYARGVTLARLEEQWDEIAAAQERVPIRILRGTESDILVDGSLDFPDRVLERFDVIIASIHARHRLDRHHMTERLRRALSLPIFKVWGHGLGRILNHRPPIDCDVPAVLDALAGSRGAIELNADPHRLDLPSIWLPAARARGIPFIISVDAHSTRGFGVLRHGVSLARRGGVPKHEVLNTLPAEEFAAAVKPA